MKRFLQKNQHAIPIFIGIVFLILLIPLTIILLRQRQNVNSHAVASTTISFSPTSSQASPIQVAVGSPVDLSLNLDPGSNLVSFAKLEIDYDATRFAPISGTAAFVPNSTVFPKVVEGPFYSSGKIQVTLSIGSDPTLAIQAPATIGTVHLQAIANGTSSQPAISFAGISEVQSIGSHDSASENVLANAIPGYINVGAGPTITPGPSATITPTRPPITPTPTSTLPSVTITNPINGATINGSLQMPASATASSPNGTITKVDYYLDSDTTPDATATTSPYNVTLNMFGYHHDDCASHTIRLTAKATDSLGLVGQNAVTFTWIDTCPNTTPSISPSIAPSITPTPKPSGTPMSFTVFLHGIGHSGDNANPTAYSLSNQTPHHPERNLTIEAYDNTNTLISSGSGTITYSASDGNFTGTANMDTFLPNGHYTIMVKTDQYLKAQIPGIQTITGTANNTFSPITLVTGDVNNDNAVNILDYNDIMNCMQVNNQTPSSCTSEEAQATDINDDGVVDQVDYNLFVRELSTEHGSQSPSQARDQERKTDLNQIQSALEKYKAASGFYPKTPFGTVVTFEYPRTCGGALSFNNVTFINVPCDPLYSSSNLAAYRYAYVASPDSCDDASTSSPCTGYTVTACLENANDPQGKPLSSLPAFPTPGLTCPSDTVLQVQNQ